MCFIEGTGFAFPSIYWEKVTFEEKPDIFGLEIIVC
jgi:hypothetical protein